MGTCYTLDELRAIGEFCRAEDLLLYIDGARLANSAAFLGCTLAELAAHADVLSFGGTKNGAVGAEALIVMNADLMAAAPVPADAAAAAGLEDALHGRPVRRAARPTSCGGATRARPTRWRLRLADSVSRRAGAAAGLPGEANAVFAILPQEQTTRLQRGLELPRLGRARRPGEQWSGGWSRSTPARPTLTSSRRPSARPRGRSASPHPDHGPTRQRPGPVSRETAQAAVAFRRRGGA